MAFLLRLFILFAMVFLLFEGVAVVRFWFKSNMVGTPIPIGRLFLMRMRNLKINPLLSAWTRAQHAHLDVTLSQLEKLQQLGGEVEVVIQKMIKAKAAGEPLTFNHAANDHLAGEKAPVLAVYNGEDRSNRVVDQSHD